MTKDSKLNVARKDTKKMKKNDEHARRKKQNVSSDDDNSFIASSDSEEEQMDEHEYRKFLQKIFPSKHLEKKIKAGERVKKSIQLNNESSESEQELSFLKF